MQGCPLVTRGRQRWQFCSGKSISQGQLVSRLLQPNAGAPPPACPGPLLHLATWQMMMSTRQGPWAKRNEQKRRQRKREEARANHDRLEAAGGAAAWGQQQGQQLEQMKKMYAEPLVCHKRVISSYRSRQSRITRIIQPPRLRLRSLPPSFFPGARTHMTWVFASLRRQHSAGLAFLFAPAATSLLLILLRRSTHNRPNPAPSGAAYRDIM